LPWSCSQLPLSRSSWARSSAVAAGAERGDVAGQLGELGAGGLTVALDEGELDGEAAEGVAAGVGAIARAGDPRGQLGADVAGHAHRRAEAEDLEVAGRGDLGGLGVDDHVGGRGDLAASTRPRAGDRGDEGEEREAGCCPRGHVHHPV
jgi:hypothetical protein